MAKQKKKYYSSESKYDKYNDNGRIAKNNERFLQEQKSKGLPWYQRADGGLTD